MASFFISHSSRDNSVAADLRRWLQEQGFSSLFLDFDPEDGIPPGRRWEEELYSELRKADVLLFLGTRAAVESRWCHTELAFARSLGRTIVPITLEDGAVHPLVSDTEWIRIDPHGSGVFAPLAGALSRLGIDPLDTLDWDPNQPPYPGLLPFGEDRAGVFFGRDEEVRAVLDHLRLQSTERSERLVLIAGPSGSGKSSIVRAGVVPRLRRLDVPRLVVPPFSPDGRPLARLAQALCDALATYGREVDWRECEVRLAGAREGLAGYVDDLLVAARLPDSGDIVLVIDQGERLATQSEPQERIMLLDLVFGALRRTGRLRVLMTARSEYLSDIVESTEFEGQALPIVSVGRLSPERLGEVIERPAQRAGIAFEPGIVQRLIEETTRGAPTGGDPLPLLAFALRELFDSRANPTTISWVDYERVGGVVAGLRKAADRVHEQLSRRGQGDLVVPTLLELVHVDPEREPSSRPVSRRRFTEAARDVVDAFVEARLLTTEGEEPHIHVAHEALLREWPLLAEAIESFGDNLMARSRLNDAAAEWEHFGRNPDALYRGARLAAALEYADDIDASLGETERAFLEASRQEQLRIERDALEQALRLAATEAKGRRLARRLSGVLGGAVVALLLVVGIALQQRSAALSEKRAALSNELAARSTATLPTDPTGSLRLALQALVTQPTPQAVLAYTNALAVPHARLSLEGHGERSRSLMIAPDIPRPISLRATHSPDGKRIVTASTIGGTHVWDAITGKRLVSLTGIAAYARTAEFSPDGSRLLTTTADEPSVVLWDSRSGARVAVLGGVTDGHSAITSARFSPNGRWIVIAATDGTARVLSLQDEKLSVLQSPGPRSRALTSITDAAFSPNGQHLLTVGTDGKVRLWEWRTARQLSAVDGMAGAFSPDGKRIPTGSREGPFGKPGIPAIHIRDLVSGEVLVVMRGEPGALIRSIAFSPDSAELVTANFGEMADVWDAQSGDRLATLKFPTNPISEGAMTAEFSPNGQAILTMSSDGKARLWVTRGLIAVLDRARDAAATGGPNRALFSPTGKVIATVANDQRVGVITRIRSSATISLWDAGAGRRLVVIHSASQVRDVAFSPDGRLLAVVESSKGFGQGAVVRLIETKTGRQVAIFESNAGYITNAEFTPDGRRLIVPGTDGLHILDGATGRHLQEVRLRAPVELDATPGVLSRDGRRIVMPGSIMMGEGPHARILGRLVVFDIATGREVAVLKTPGHVGAAIDLSPDGQRIVTGGGVVRLWDASSGKQLRIIDQTREDIVQDVEFSPDGKELLTAAADGTLASWDAASGRRLASFVGVGGSLYQAVFSANGRYIAATSRNGTTGIWDASGGTPLATLKSARGSSWRVSFSPDGRRVVVVADDATRLYECIPCASRLSLVEEAKRLLAELPS
ncbi:MAG: TIR domain-containing protein [Actinomycetota bacterium]